MIKETRNGNRRQHKTRQIRQDKARQEKTRQDKTTQDNTRQDNTSHHKPTQALTQDKPPHDVRRQDTTRTDKTIQHETAPYHTPRQGPKKEFSGLGLSPTTFCPSLFSFSLVTTQFASSPTPICFCCFNWWILCFFF